MRKNHLGVLFKMQVLGVLSPHDSNLVHHKRSVEIILTSTPRYFYLGGPQKNTIKNPFIKIKIKGIKISFIEYINGESDFPINLFLFLFLIRGYD